MENQQIIEELSDKEEVIDEKKNLLNSIILFKDESINLIKQFTSKLTLFIKKNKKIFKGGKQKTKRVPTAGITCPTLIPESLAVFFELPLDTKLSRSEITKMLYKYINENKLYNEKNKSIIMPNDKLAQLFNLSKGQIFKHTEFQKYLARIYPKIVPEEIAKLLDLDTNIKISKNDIYSLFAKYIIQQKLVNKKTSNIKLNQDLSTLFKLPQNEEITLITFNQLIDKFY